MGLSNMSEKTDEDGVWEEIQQPSGAIVRILLAPSASFDAERAARPENPALSIEETVLKILKDKGLV